jgi:hypothetical protein
LCGGRENPPKKHFQINIKRPLSGRVHRGAPYSLRAVESSSWTPAGGQAVACFEDGSAAVLMNQFGKGICFTIPLSLGDAVRAEPGLVRDILDEALGQDGSPRLFDVVGLDEQCDIAMSGDDERRVFAVVNYKKMPIEIDILPLRLERKTKYALTDLRTGAELRTRSGQDLAHIKMTVPGIDYICLSLVAKR